MQVRGKPFPPRFSNIFFFFDTRALHKTFSQLLIRAFFLQGIFFFRSAVIAEFLFEHIAINSYRTLVTHRFENHWYPAASAADPR